MDRTPTKEDGIMKKAVFAMVAWLWRFQDVELKTPEELFHQAETDRNRLLTRT